MCRAYPVFEMLLSLCLKNCSLRNLNNETLCFYKTESDRHKNAVKLVYRQQQNVLKLVFGD